MNVASTQLLSQQAIRDVDAAVRDVLTALRGFRVDPSTLVAMVVAQSNDGVFTFSGRLLSLRAVESLSSSLKVVEITPGTVVTPSLVIC
ncbi:MAG: hypothetical protein U0794_15925 [Isosphaeraceae bacterium]